MVGMVNKRFCHFLLSVR